MNAFMVSCEVNRFVLFPYFYLEALLCQVPLVLGSSPLFFFFYSIVNAGCSNVFPSTVGFVQEKGLIMCSGLNYSFNSYSIFNCCANK